VTSRSWVLLPSGARLDLLNPDPNAWTDQDLARRISEVPRWAGASVWPEKLSVAQHSLLVLQLRQAMQPTRPLSARSALRELLHDAEEAFLGFDPLSPLKVALGDAFQQVTRPIEAAIASRYQLRPWTPDEYRFHKSADEAAAAGEAVHCAGWALHELGPVLGIRAGVPPIDVLARIYGETPWRPWPVAVAESRFLACLQDLLARSELDERASADLALSAE